MQSTKRQHYAPAFHAAAAAPTETDEPLLLSSATAVSGNVDLLAEILRCLPIKSLVRAKTVSKQWLSLIQSPFFSRLRNPNPNLASGLFFHKGKQLFYIPMDTNNYRKYDVTVREALTFFNDKNPNLFVTQSCNGLLLCVCRLSKSMYVVNPTTKQLRAIPPPFSPNWNCRGATLVWRATLAFDPTKSPHYKLVALYYEIHSVKNYYEIAIYNSKTSGWRIVSDFQMPLSFYCTNGVFWNGAINWFSRGGEAAVYIKVDEESLHTMPMPPIPPGRFRMVRYFGEHRGHLYLVLLHDDDGLESEFTVYEMKRDYSSWFVKYSLHFNEFVAAFPDVEYYCFKHSDLGMVVGMENTADDGGREWLLIVHMVVPPYSVVSYNFKHKKFEEISPFSYIMSSSSSGTIVVTGRSSKFYPYIESLSHV